MKFESVIGVSQHRRHLHTAIYNKDSEAKALATRKKRPRSIAEDDHLAELEVEFKRNPKSMPLRAYLAQEMGRSLDAIKSV